MSSIDDVGEAALKAVQRKDSPDYFASDAVVQMALSYEILKELRKIAGMLENNVRNR